MPFSFPNQMSLEYIRSVTGLANVFFWRCNVHESAALILVGHKPLSVSNSFNLASNSLGRMVKSCAGPNCLSLITESAVSRGSSFWIAFASARSSAASLSNSSDRWASPLPCPHRTCLLAVLVVVLHMQTPSNGS